MYQLYNTKRTNRTARMLRWMSIPIILGILFVLFATNGFDIVLTFARNIPTLIEQRLDTIEHRTQVFETKRDIDYFPGLSIQDILRGQNRYTVDKDIPLPDVDAFAYVVGDVVSGEIIFEKNGDEVLPIASVTKLMTASVALEELSETTVATVSARAQATESARGMFRVNEQIQVSDLLYPLLLVSSNDASEVLAETLGRKNFIQAMNRQASTLGMYSTNFDDPSGLSEKNTSTARDLFRLANYLHNNHESVFEISKLKEYSQGGRTWSNTNRFAGVQNYEGGKTGFTSKAKRTGVALFTIPFEGYGERTIAITILRTDNRVEDYNKILQFITNHVAYSVAPLHAEEMHTQPISLAFIGDMMFDRGVRNSVERNFNNDYNKLFEFLPQLKHADISFGNLEGPISTRGTNVGSKYSFRFDPYVAPALKNSGIDIVSFANNHVGDWSQEAFQDTLTHLSETGVLYTGAGYNTQEASQVTIIESRGIKVGFLGFTDVGPNWMKAGTQTPGILLASDPNRLQYISEAKSKVDILVVSYHWGDEYVEHNERQELLAKSSIDAGADIIIGHHPHVIQDIEQYNDGLIAYSLGNAIFDQHFSQATMEGMLLEVLVDTNGIVSYTNSTFPISTQFQPQNPTPSQSQTTGEVLQSFDSRDTITVSWVGDIIPGNPNREPLTDPDSLFTHVRDWIQDADIAIGNLEGVLTHETQSKCDLRTSSQCFAFKATPSMSENLRSAGFDALVVANNHSFDFGLQGFEDTIQNLQSKNIQAVGAKNSITYHTERGITIAMIAFTHDSRLNSIADMQTLRSLVKEASKKSDVVLTFFHGGAEGSDKQHTPEGTEIFLGEYRGDLRTFARAAIDAGADAVFGSGPHVIRGIEFYEEKPIIYSVGNFAGYNTLYLDDITKIGLGVTLEFSRDGLWRDGKVQFFDLGTNGIPKPTQEKSLTYTLNTLSRQDFEARAGLVQEDFTLVHQPLQALWHGKFVSSSCPNPSDENKTFNTLIDVGAHNTLSKSFIPPRLLELPSEVQYGNRTICIEETAAHAFMEMHHAAQEDSISLVATSGFRDYQTQAQLFEDWKRHNGSRYNLLAVAPAGHSEHQLGTTIDVSSEEIGFESATERFTNTNTYTWLTQHAAQFGFIQSFIPGSESVTGYIPESWHWRYVGPEHAQAIQNLQISALEYLKKL